MISDVKEILKKPSEKENVKRKVLREPEELDEKTFRRRKGKDACRCRGLMIEKDEVFLMIIFSGCWALVWSRG